MMIRQWMEQGGMGCHTHLIANLMNPHEIGGSSAERHPSTARSSGSSAVLHAYVTWSDVMQSADSVEQLA